jgi:hypothetical protein
LKYVFLFSSIVSMSQLIHNIHSSEVVLELDASEEDSPSDACSGHEEEAAESDDERGVTPVVIETDNGREVQDSEYAGE